MIRGHEFVNGIKMYQNVLSVFSCSCYQGIFSSSCGYLSIDNQNCISFHILQGISMKQLDKINKSKKKKEVDEKK